MNLQVIEKALNKQPFDVQIRGRAAYETLQDVDGMLSKFEARKNDDKDDILLDVYGLLQSLFVGIDSLYQLIIGATKYKYHININQNPVLRELKYIRNDVVGHPTNRTYQNGSYGFSIIEDKEIKRTHLSYDTYLIEGKTIKKQSRQIVFQDIIEQYRVEKNKTYEDLIAFITKGQHSIASSGLLTRLFQQIMQKEDALKLVDRIQKEFLKEQSLKKETSNRLLWRLKIIKKLLLWENSQYHDVVDYAVRNEVLRVYQMNAQLNKRKARMPEVETPDILLSFNKKFQQNQDLALLTQHFNDRQHPMFEHDYQALLKSSLSDTLRDFVRWFYEIKDKDVSFAIGNVLKTYVKRVGK